MNRVHGLPDTPLPSLITKGNAVAPSPLPGAPYQITSKDSFDRGIRDRQHDAAMFSDSHDHDQQSTPTLAGSNGGARFPSGHSSTSTLNHEEPHATSGVWEDSNSPRESSPTDVNKVQNAVPSVWANAVGNAREQQTPLHGMHSSALDQPAAEDATHPKRDVPVGPTQLPAVPSLSNHAGESISDLPVQDDHTHKPVERESTAEPLISDISSANTPSTPSLFLSVLPINPALGISRRSLPPEKTDTPPQTLPERPKSAHKLTTFLSESLLPINPAFKERLTQNH